MLNRYQLLTYWQAKLECELPAVKILHPKAMEVCVVLLLLSLLGTGNWQGTDKYKCFDVCMVHNGYE